jgi:hypothetical protein
VAGTASILLSLLLLPNVLEAGLCPAYVAWGASFALVAAAGALRAAGRG